MANSRLVFGVYDQYATVAGLKYMSLRTPKGRRLDQGF